MSLATLRLPSAPTRIGLTSLPSDAYRNSILGLNALRTLPSDAASYGSILSAIPRAPTAAAPGSAPASAKPSTDSSTGVDYDKLLSSDQILQSQLAGINGQGTANQAQLTALRQRALGQFGEVPTDLSGTLTGDVNADVDQTTRDLAAKATQGGVSTVAQLSHAYDVQRQGSLNSLAARGMLRSGALGQHTNEDLGAYQRAGYDAHQQLLDYLTGVYQNYLGLQAKGQTGAAEATNKALERIIAQINADALAKQLAASRTPETPTPTFDQPTPTYVPGPDVNGPTVNYPDVGSISTPTVQQTPTALTYWPSDADRTLAPRRKASPSQSGRGLSAGLRIQ